MLHVEPFFYFNCSKEIAKYLRFLEIKRAFPFSSVECWHNGKEITVHPTRTDSSCPISQPDLSFNPVYFSQ